jgi:hypothetical protein
MAYATGTVSTKTDLFDAITAFLVANGWSLYDTVSSSADTKDKVYRSTGTVSGRPYVYLRVRETKNEQIREYTQWPMPGIHFLGYRAWTIGNPAAAVGEFGLLKEWRRSRVPFAGTPYNYVTIAGSGANNSVPNVSRYELGTPWLFQHNAININNYIAYTLGRKLITKRTDNGGMVEVFDHSGVSQPQYIAVTLDGTNAAKGFIPVTDKSTGQDYCYSTQAGGLSKMFGKYNLTTGVYTYLADPPWGGAVPQTNSQLFWDGDDTIYALRGDATASFARYSIAGNTWTSLSNAPAVISTNPTCKPFIWKAANSGMAEDRIYFGGWAASWFYYGTTNGWSNGTTFPHPASRPVTDANLTNEFDGDYLWATGTGVASNDTVYIYTPTAAGAGSWTTNASRLFSGGASDSSFLHYLTQPLSYIPCPTAGAVTYWICGNADSITVAIRNSGNYWWSHAGFLDSYYDNLLLPTTGPIAPGPNVTATVVGTVPWSVGDKVQLFDPTTTSSEMVTIANIAGNVLTFSTVSLTFSTGTLVGRDPCPFVITGNARLGSFPSSMGKYRSGGFYDWYKMSSFNVGNELNIFAQGRMGYRLWPMDAFMDQQLYVPETFEIRGRLKNVFMVKSGLNNEDILQFGTDKYLVLYDFYTKGWSSGDTRGVAIAMQ